MEIKKELPVITLATAASYIAAYLFQFGFLVYYGLPLEFVSVDVNSVLTTAFVIVFVCYFIFQAHYQLNSSANSKFKSEKIFFRVTYLIYALLLSTLVTYLYTGVVVYKIITTESVVVFLTTLVFFHFTLKIMAYFVHSAILAINDKMAPGRNNSIVLFSFMILLAVYGAGRIYPIINVGKYEYNNSGSYMVMENPKGIFLVSCDNFGDIKFKRVNSEYATFTINRDREKVKKLKDCISVARSGSFSENIIESEKEQLGQEFSKSYISETYLAW